MKRAASIIFALFMSAALLCGCSPQATPVRNDVANADIVDFHTDRQEAYITAPFGDIAKFAKGKKDLSAPEPIVLSWEGDSAAEYTVSISDNSDMASALTYTVSDTSLSVYNLLLDTQYYWTYSTGGKSSDVFIFTTSDDAPRNLYVDGVKNVRDLGGWLTDSGKRTNQGMIYRCGRLNESSAKTPVIEITDSGIGTMRDTLGVKAEIDLRKVKEGEIGGITASPLGDDIKYFNCPMVWDGDILMDNREQVLNVFAILGDRSNYPIIFHCNIGTDRTGMIAFLVNALCGVSEDDIKRDYLFSNFSEIGGKRTISDMEGSGYYKAVMAADGVTLSEKAYNCLLGIGVPASDLDTIISIMTE